MLRRISLLQVIDRFFSYLLAVDSVKEGALIRVKSFGGKDFVKSIIVLCSLVMA